MIATIPRAVAFELGGVGARVPHSFVRAAQHEGVAHGQRLRRSQRVVLPVEAQHQVRQASPVEVEQAGEWIEHRCLSFSVQSSLCIRRGRGRDGYVS